MPEWLLYPWPWYVAGPLIGLFPAIVLLLGNRPFGVSSTLRHVCAVTWPGQSDYFRYDWRRLGAWNLAFTGGILIGGVIAGWVLRNPEPVAIADETRAALAQLSVTRIDALVPAEVFSWRNLASVRGAVLLLGGGFLVGFGSAYAGGCTSGHGLAGIADLQLPSVVALGGFFFGGIAATFLLLPLLL